MSTYRIAERMGATHMLVKKWLAAAGLEYTPKQKKRTGAELKWGTIVFSSSPGRRVSPKLYRAWVKMRERCRGHEAHHRRSYLEKGITVCAAWLVYESFRKWALANGFRKGLSLDRINGNGNYEPTNCRWATKREQQNNTSRTHILTLNGVSKPLTHWAAELGLNPVLLRSRMNHGWTDEQALTIPHGKARPGGKPRGRAAAKAKRLAAQQLST